jgi:MoxR-like ATPase
MFLIKVDYPSEAEERRIARETTGLAAARLSAVIDGPAILAHQDLVRRVPVPDHVYDFAVRLVRLSRPGAEGAPPWVKEWVQWGAGPRAVQYLVLGAKARAVLRGSYLVQLEDVNAVADPVLNHRILTNFHAESEGITSSEIVRRLVEAASAGA